MRYPRRLSRLALFLALFGVLVLAAGTAFAAGGIAYTRKEIAESNGGWHIQMTITYGGMPSMPHVPMKFSFTPIGLYERYLDDAHKDKPQMRKIPLVGQMPIIESVDVDFSDPRGKLYNKTKFDFTVTRSHNFAAGEYSVTVRRADGTQMGPAQTLVFNGENPIIDRRAISFVASSGKKDAGAPQAAAAQGGSENAAAAPAASAEPAAASPDEAKGASEAPADTDGGVDPVAEAKVPPGSHGCGCRTAGTSTGGAAAWAFLAGLGLMVQRARRRLPASERQ
jgi:MYXO-CTERM domain-containing protein